MNVFLAKRFLLVCLYIRAKIKECKENCHAQKVSLSLVLLIAKQK
jgi:hypothetical protein